MSLRRDRAPGVAAPSAVALRVLIALFVCVLALAGSAVAATTATGGWTQLAKPRSQTASRTLDYTAVSCPSASTCFVTGRTGRGPLLDRYAGGRLTALAPPPRRPAAGVTGLTLAGLACPTARFCLAVGSAMVHGHTVPAAERFNGRSWKALPVAGASPQAAHGTSRNVLSSIACPAARWCVAVGASTPPGAARDRERPLVELFNGTRWRIVHTATTRGPLESVSCTSPGACTAVGDDESGAPGYRDEIERLHGTRWTREPLTLPPGASAAGLHGVSCSSATRCVGVGVARYAGGTHALLARWSTDVWSTETLPVLGASSGSVSERLRAVSCPRGLSGRCDAVGGWTHAGAAGGLGVRIARDAPADKRHMPAGEAVACPTVRLCLAVGGRFVVRAS